MGPPCWADPCRPKRGNLQLIALGLGQSIICECVGLNGLLELNDNVIHGQTVSGQGIHFLNHAFALGA